MEILEAIFPFTLTSIALFLLAGYTLDGQWKNFGPSETTTSTPTKQCL
jgi:hypothetical protein